MMYVNEWMVLLLSFGWSIAIVSSVYFVKEMEKRRALENQFYNLREVAEHLANRLMRYDVKVQFRVSNDFKVIYVEDISKKESE